MCDHHPHPPAPVSWIMVGIKRILAFRDYPCPAFDLAYKELRPKKQQCEWSKVRRVQGRAEILMVIITSSSLTADLFVFS